MEVVASSYKGFRFPAGVISDCVWLYYRFPLSFCEVEEMTLQRGIVVSHQTIRQWCARFGQSYADRLRRRRPRPGDKWHLDEVFITINTKTRYLWRAVDQHGNVLDILVTSRWDTKAATRFFRQLLTGVEYVPGVLVTDKLGWLPRGATPGSAFSRIPPLEVSEQPGGDLPPARPGPGTGDEEVHLARSRPAVLIRVQWDIASLAASASPARRRCLRREMRTRFSTWNEVTGTATAA